MQRLLVPEPLLHNYIIMVKVKVAKFSQTQAYEEAVYCSQNNTYQNLENLMSLPFYQDFIFVKNMNAAQQVAQFTRELLCEAASFKGAQP